MRSMMRTITGTWCAVVLILVENHEETTPKASRPVKPIIIDAIIVEPQSGVLIRVTSKFDFKVVWLYIGLLTNHAAVFFFQCLDDCWRWASLNNRKIKTGVHVIITIKKNQENETRIVCSAACMDNTKKGVWYHVVVVAAVPSLHSIPNEFVILKRALLLCKLMMSSYNFSTTMVKVIYTHWNLLSIAIVVLLPFLLLIIIFK